MKVVNSEGGLQAHSREALKGGRDNEELTNSLAPFNIGHVTLLNLIIHFALRVAILGPTAFSSADCPLICKNRRTAR